MKLDQTESRKDTTNKVDNGKQSRNKTAGYINVEKSRIYSAIHYKEAKKEK